MQSDRRHQKHHENLLHNAWGPPHLHPGHVAFETSTQKAQESIWAGSPGPASKGAWPVGSALPGQSRETSPTRRGLRCPGDGARARRRSAGVPRPPPPPPPRLPL